MAALDVRIWEAGNGASVTVTIDDVTGEIQGVAWVVPSGTLRITIQRAGQPDLTLTKTADGSQNVPAGRYFLVKDRAGGWSWRQASYSIGWTP